MKINLHWFDFDTFPPLLSHFVFAPASSILYQTTCLPTAMKILILYVGWIVGSALALAIVPINPEDNNIEIREESGFSITTTKAEEVRKLFTYYNETGDAKTGPAAPSTSGFKPTQVDIYDGLKGDGLIVRPLSNDSRVAISLKPIPELELIGPLSQRDLEARQWDRQCSLYFYCHSTYMNALPYNWVWAGNHVYPGYGSNSFGLQGEQYNIYDSTFNINGGPGGNTVVFSYNTEEWGCFLQFNVFRCTVDIGIGAQFGSWNYLGS